MKCVWSFRQLVRGSLHGCDTGQVEGQEGRLDVAGVLDGHLRCPGERRVGCARAGAIGAQGLARGLTWMWSGSLRSVAVLSWVICAPRARGKKPVSVWLQHAGRFFVPSAGGSRVLFAGDVEPARCRVVRERTQRSGSSRRGWCERSICREPVAFLLWPGSFRRVV